MRLVLDTNILIAALMKDSLTREILLLPGLEFLLPEFALAELTAHRAKIARRSRLKLDELDVLLSLLLESVTVVPSERIMPQWRAAERLIGGRDPDDVPFVALALAESNDGIWSNDRAFQGLTGITAWKTEDLKVYLRR